MCTSFQTKVFCIAVLGFFVAYVPFVHAACKPVSMNGAQVALTSSLAQTVPGATIGLTVTPSGIGGLFAGNVALAIEVTAPDGGIVDRFFATTTVQEGAIPVLWRVPSGLVPGTYTVAAILVPDKTSYGDVFTNDTLPRASTPVAITSDTDMRVTIRDGVVVSRGDDGTVHLLTTVTNNTDIPYDGEITWRVWTDTTAFNREPVLTRTVPAKIHPHMSDRLVLDIPHAEDGTYYIEAKTSNARFTSYADVWIADGAADVTTCADSPSVAPSFRLWQALGLIVLLMAVGVAWSRVSNHSRRRSAHV